MMRLLFITLVLLLSTRAEAFLSPISSPSGSVTSVGLSVPSFLSVSGSPVTTSGTLAVTFSGTALPIANGGTGQTTAPNAINALLPTQTGNGGKFLTTDGSVSSWGAASGTGTVTSVSFSDTSMPSAIFNVTGSPVTTSGTLSISTKDQDGHKALIGPDGGTPAAPTFRTLVPNDMALSGTDQQVLGTNGTGSFFWADGALIGGNTFGGVIRLGTKDSNRLTLITNDTGQVFIEPDGNVGIGDTPQTGVKLTITSNDISAPATVGISDYANTHITTNTDNQTIGLLANVGTIVDAGFTNAGVVVGLAGFASRHDPSDAGTLHAIAGLLYGIDVGNTDPAAVTDIAVSLGVQSKFKSGTVTDLFDILVVPKEITGATVINNHGLFISPDDIGTKLNYLTGLTQFGGTYTAPTSVVEVNGDLGLNGSTSGKFSQSAANITTTYSVKWPAAQGAASTMLQNDGAGNLTWAAGGGGGATTALDNLASVAINAELDFQTGQTGIIKSGDDTPFTQDMQLESGDSTGGDGNTGNVLVASGIPTGAGNSGDVNITSGAGAAGTSGSSALRSGDMSAGATGNLYFTTGTPGNNFSSGNLVFLSGDVTGSGNAGSVSFSPAAAVDGASGSISLIVQEASGTGTTGTIKFVTPTTPAVGYDWKATNADGSGDWSINTWQSTIAYSTNSYSSDGVNAPADAISFVSGMVGQTHYLASDDNNGSTGDGTPSPLGIIAGSYTGTDAGMTPGASLTLQAGNNHQSGWTLGSEAGGNLNMYAGSAVGSGDGGSVSINGGNASHGGNGNGGYIELAGGSPSGTGAIGHITLTSAYTQMNSPVMILPTATTDAAGASQGWFYYNTSTEKLRLHNATVWVDVGSGSGATTALDNLASVQINSDLIFGIDTAGTLKTNDKPTGSTTPLSIATGDPNPGAASVSGNLNLTTGAAPFTGSDSGNINIESGASYNSGIAALRSGVATATSGEVRAISGDGFITGNTVIGTGVATNTSGNIYLTTGTGPTRGNIKFQDGTEGVAGYAWMSADVNGTGMWAPFPISGATVSLDNLSSVAINTDLIFAVDLPGALKTSDKPSGNSTPLTITTGDSDPTTGSLTGDLNLFTGASPFSGSQSGNINAISGPSANSGIVTIGSGDGSDTSGNTIIKVGTASIRGQIKLVDGSEGTSGDVWTSTGTGGEGAWAPSVATLPAPLEAVTSYTPGTLGILGSFVGNVSDSDQTNLAVAFGSTDTAIAGNSTSVVNIVGGDNSASSSTGNAATINIQAGSISNTGTGAAGNVIIGGGQADSNLGGNVSINGGSSVSGSGGGILLQGGSSSSSTAGNILLQTTAGTGGVRGKIQFQDGSEGTSGKVWTSTDTSGSGAWSGAPQGTVCGWNDNGSLLSNCIGNDPATACPSGYTQKTALLTQKFCVAN